VRGMELSAEDRLCRDVITALFCQGGLSAETLRREHGVDFAAHFAAALRALEPMAADGLVRVHAAGVEVTELGRLFLRNIAQAFDEYGRPEAADKPLFSRTV
jgi:oxygen-independent coproporphyrinogen-3 oxidase